MKGTSIIVPPPGMPTVALKDLLGRPGVSAVFEIGPGEFGLLDHELADRYLRSGVYIILVFEDVADAIELQRLVAVMRGRMQ